MITYIGNCNIEEIPGTKLAKNEFDLDVLTRVFYGRADQLTGFLQGYRKYVRDGEFPSMAKNTHNVTYEDGRMVTVEINFVGLLTNELPTVTVDDSTSLQVATLTTDNEEDGEIQVQFYAPVSTYRYVGLSLEGSPRYTQARQTGLSIRPFNPSPPDYTGTLQYRTPQIIQQFVRSQQGVMFGYEVTVAKVIEAKFQIVEA